MLQCGNIAENNSTILSEKFFMDTLQRIVCDWCTAQSPMDATTCISCGAPLNVKNLVSDSGWREAPRLKDMTEVQFGQSRCQVEGEIVPVAEISLGGKDQIFFEHHVLLWKEDPVALGVLPLQGGINRVLAGMPYVISTAAGKGRIAFSRDAAGELVVMPMHHGMELDARGHSFLLCSHSISYTFTRIQGLRNILFGGTGMYIDRFICTNEPGLLILHGCGNVFERQLASGESILLEPGAFLYKDASVTMTVEKQQLTTGILGGFGMYLTRMTGPGRLGIQSMYHHHVAE
jgi:uncharacterized protein (AIM24 family)/ribosomal protein L40E